MPEHQRLSVRRGIREPDGPYEGVPAHLHAQLVEWVTKAAADQSGYPSKSTYMALAATLRIGLPSGADQFQAQQVFLDTLKKDEDLFLDCIDLMLAAGAGSPASLAVLLRIGGSAWTVADDKKGLERRVTESEQKAKTLALAPGDAAATELATAWSSAFGVRPDPSDAWDHAIKAIEAVLIPVVVPKQDKPTLGHVVGALKADPTFWTLDLESNGGISDGATLLALLQLVWANPDRHANANQRVPTQEEAEKVVKIAVLVLGLARNGQLRKA